MNTHEALGLRPIRRALISVSDKTGLGPVAAELRNYHIDLYSTGGTRAYIEKEGVLVDEISNLTGFPEMMDGRLKTLHPMVHGGLLFRRGNASHVEAAAEHKISPIDLVIVNLYPFQQTVGKPGATLEDAIENIDIGGPAMVRSAAKNHEDVAVITDPSQYEGLLAELKAHGGSTTFEHRRRLMVRAFEMTAAYDKAIAFYFGERYQAQPWKSAME